MSTVDTRKGPFSFPPGEKEESFDARSVGAGMLFFVAHFPGDSGWFRSDRSGSSWIMGFNGLNVGAVERSVRRNSDLPIPDFPIATLLNDMLWSCRDI